VLLLNCSCIRRLFDIDPTNCAKVFGDQLDDPQKILELTITLGTSVRWT
jgi:hypothetical protein